MKPLVVTVSIPASTFTCQVNSDEEIADGPSEEISELRVLDHYRGKWEDEISGRPSVKRTEIGEWVLNGRFLRQLWSTEASEDMPKASGITMMTFDTSSEQYRSWSFLATGTVIENEGVWDAPSRTMTWGHRVPDTGESVITKTTFIDEVTAAWSIVKLDAKDHVVREVDGRNRRRAIG